MQEQRHLRRTGGGGINTNKKQGVTTVRTKSVNRANDMFINVYNFWPVMFERGQGCHLYDTEGKKYLNSR